MRFSGSKDTGRVLCARLLAGVDASDSSGEQGPRVQDIGIFLTNTRTIYNYTNVQFGFVMSILIQACLLNKSMQTFYRDDKHGLNWIQHEDHGASEDRILVPLRAYCYAD